MNLNCLTRTNQVTVAVHIINTANRRPELVSIQIPIGEFPDLGSKTQGQSTACSHSSNDFL
jgi:hypothetical protein